MSNQFRLGGWPEWVAWKVRWFRRTKGPGKPTIYAYLVWRIGLSIYFLSTHILLLGAFSIRSPPYKSVAYCRIGVQSVSFGVIGQRLGEFHEQADRNPSQTRSVVVH